MDEDALDTNSISCNLCPIDILKVAKVRPKTPIFLGVGALTMNFFSTQVSPKCDNPILDTVC